MHRYRPRQYRMVHRLHIFGLLHLYSARLLLEQVNTWRSLHQRKPYRLLRHYAAGCPDQPGAFGAADTISLETADAKSQEDCHHRYFRSRDLVRVFLDRTFVSTDNAPLVYSLVVLSESPSWYS